MEKILRKFTVTGTGATPITSYPYFGDLFNSKHSTCATDGSILAATNRIEGYSEQFAPDITTVKDSKRIVSISVINNALATLTIIAKPIIEEIECKACNGEGDVALYYYHEGLHDYVELCETRNCPHCDGGGVVYGKQIGVKLRYNPMEEQIEINEMPFNPDYIALITEAYMELGVTEVSIYDVEHMSALCFDGGGLRVVLMSLNYDAVKKVTI
jgi:hypothetical protein